MNTFTRQEPKVLGVHKSNSHAPQMIFARELYDGQSAEAQHDVMISVHDGRISEVTQSTADTARRAGALMGEIVTPGFIDLQINGAKDVQFNFDPTAQAIAQIAAGAKEGGTAYLLPTFITAHGQDYLRAIKAAQDAIAQGTPGIIGLHLEGPFLSPKRPGIHDLRAIRIMQDADLSALCAPFPGKLMITLAPETLPDSYLKALCSAGIVVFAGHSAATAEEIHHAQALGLRGATHLFNAMSQMTGRAPGVVGAVLASDSLFAGIIPDGHHVADDNLRIAARMMEDRLCLVTDAMLTLAGVSDRFTLNGQEILLQQGRLTNAGGRLAGAHIAMDECIDRMAQITGISYGQAVKMATATPAKALGLAQKIGRIAVGYRASCSLLNAARHCCDTVIDGRL